MFFLRVNLVLYNADAWFHIILWGGRGGGGGGEQGVLASCTEFLQNFIQKKFYSVVVYFVTLIGESQAHNHHFIRNATLYIDDRIGQFLVTSNKN